MGKFLAGEVIKKEEISDILIEQPKVRRKYNELVPNDVSHDNFWSRYLFRRKIIEEKFACVSDDSTPNEPKEEDKSSFVNQDTKEDNDEVITEKKDENMPSEQAKVATSNEETS